MINTEIGASRDKKILLEVEKCGVLDTEQIRCLFFGNRAHGRRIAQHRLRLLHGRGRLQRGREYGRPYHYFLEPFKAVEHRLGVNWVYCWFVSSLKSWETMKWEYEVDIGGVRPDALVTVTNKVKKTQRIICVEFDRDTESSSDIREKYLGELGEEVFVVTVGNVKKFTGFECMHLDDIKRGLGSA